MNLFGYLLSVRLKVGSVLSCKYFLSLVLPIMVSLVSAEELQVGKVCPVNYQRDNVGILVLSRPWFHSSRLDAAYQASDDATGIGIEIHLFANTQGDTRYGNIAHCDRYRLLQVRKTTARLLAGEDRIQIDIPEDAKEPFSDSGSLEFGHGTHITPADSRDKPWRGRVVRASTVALYDTPYVSAYFGIEGKDIEVRFETCAVCERDSGFDSLLSCASWGYRREYIGGFTGWTEPEPLAMQCQAALSQEYEDAIDRSNVVSYSYWLDWR